MDIYELLDKELKIKMLYELKKTMHEQNNNVNKEIVSKRTKQNFGA